MKNIRTQDLKLQRPTKTSSSLSPCPFILLVSRAKLGGWQKKGEQLARKYGREGTQQFRTRGSSDPSTCYFNRLLSVKGEGES